MRKRRLTTATALAALLVAAWTAAAAAQEWKVVDDDWCHGSRCEVRELTLDPRDELAVKTVNGNIEVESWDRNEIRIRARVKVSRGSDADALFDEIEIETGDVIRARGPKRRGGFLGFFGSRNWSVSYRVMVPRETALAVHTTNGDIEVSRVMGDIEFDTTNGGVKLLDVGGDVEGGTTNGGIRVGLHAREWDGEEIDLHTTNGGIKVDLPDDFSGRIDVATTNGGIDVDYPVTIESKHRNRLKGTIGEGDGAYVKARTTNGGVSLRRADA